MYVYSYVNSKGIKAGLAEFGRHDELKHLRVDVIQGQCHSVRQEAQLMLTNRATRLEVSQGHQT